MSSKLKAGIVAGVAATMLFAAPAAANNGRGSGSGHFTVNTKADTTDANPGDGKCKDASRKCSLRAAVQEANALAGPNSIKLGHGYYTLTLTGASEDAAATGDLDITSEISITGKNASVDLVGLGDRGFDVHAGASLTVDHVRVHNGTPPTTESGGAFRSAGYLDLFEVAATNNVVSGAGASGGAIANVGGKLVVKQSYLANNSATRAGGAIEAVAGTTIVERSLLTINSTGPTPGNGGALHLTGAGDVQVIDSLVNSNVASAEGGGLWNSAVGTMTVRNTVLGGNVANGVDADQGGGALFNDGGTMKVAGSWITGNSAPMGSGSGGAIFNNTGMLSVDATSIEANTAARAGGAIETLAGTVTVTGSNVASNNTGPRPGNGGGLHVSGAGNVTFESSNVSGNTAANEGGGLWNSAVGTMVVNNTAVNDNAANGDAADEGGGGLFNQSNADGTSGGTLTVTNSKVNNNTATVGSGSGGGILNERGTLTVRGTEIHGNTSNRAGGGIEAVGGATADSVGSTTLEGVSLTGNSTGSSPGNGGGLHLTGTSTVTISDSWVAYNFAANEGGGLWNSPTGTMTATNTTINENTVGIADNGPNKFQKGPVNGGVFTVDGTVIAEGPNTLARP